MRVHLIRHGEVENPEGIRYGRLPSFRLSERGREEMQSAAKALAEAFLSGRALSGLVVSPLERAQESAEILNRIVGGPEPHVDPRLIEALEWRQGLPRTFALEPTLARVFRMRSWPETELPWTIASRVHEAVRDLVRQYGETDGDVALVTHQTPIRLGRLAFEREVTTKATWAYWKYPCATASITTFVFEGDRFVRAEYRAPSAR